MQKYLFIYIINIPFCENFFFFFSKCMCISLLPKKKKKKKKKKIPLKYLL
ncbi:hypothetical protein [Plasmodium yoelii yoelii]|uniref:Uncharacterized protein n=1 Tax=Plasmodium yoelii yoelii TaxID=73239 RepID=Q7RPV1_PLAYO|nr:hypothetical protein [Plasmodium yoelii yoelii]